MHCADDGRLQRASILSTYVYVVQDKKLKLRRTQPSELSMARAFRVGLRLDDVVSVRLHGIFYYVCTYNFHSDLVVNAIDHCIILKNVKVNHKPSRYRYLRQDPIPSIHLRYTP